MNTRTVLASIFLLLAFTPNAMGSTPLSGERTVDDAAPGFTPAVTVRGDGDLIIAWSGADEPASFGVLLRLFDADGRPKGPTFRAKGRTAGDQGLPAVAADARGNFVVAWQDTPRPGSPGGGDGDGSGVFAQLFRQDGRRTGPPLRLSPSPDRFQTEPDVAMDAGGSFVAAWQDCALALICNFYVVSRFSATGVRQGHDLVIEANPPSTHGDISRPLVVGDGNRFVVGWTEYGGCFDKQPVSVIQPIRRGAPANRFQLTDPDCGTQSWDLAALAASPQGHLSVALFNGGRNSVQLFGRNGEPFGPRKVVGNPDPCTRNDNCERLVDAAMNSGGDFAVIWQRWFRDAGGALRSEVLAQLFDRSAAPLGERFKVNESQPHAGTGPVAALSDDGTLTVVWSRLDKALVLRQFQAD